MVTSLKGILKEEEANPSLPVDYGVDLPGDYVYDMFMQQDDVRNLTMGERLSCMCYSCDFKAEWMNKTVIVRRQRKAESKKCSVEESNYLSNTVEVDPRTAGR